MHLKKGENVNRRSLGAKQLAQLREDGFQVRVQHTRQELLDGDSPYGGKTEVAIYAKDDAECLDPVATGEALCRPDERFDRRLGFTIAMGRAVHALEEGMG
jgi:hypothetical protein